MSATSGSVMAVTAETERRVASAVRTVALAAMSDPTEAPVPDRSVWVIVVAAGSGDRFGGPKQYAALADRRVLDWSLDAARTVADGIVLVVPEGELGRVEPAVDRVVAGGKTRSGSVRAGLAAVPDEAGIVLVHDGARPLAGPDLFRSVADAVRAGADAVVPVVAVTDTVVDPSGGPIDRERLRAVQTPQGFDAGVLRRVHAIAVEATDDAGLVTASGGRVRQVAGDRWNLKITEPDDLVVAEALVMRS